MKEWYYINLERMEAIKKEWDTMDKLAPLTKEEKLESGFEPRDFPEREPLQIKRRRTREEVRKLIFDT